MTNDKGAIEGPYTDGWGRGAYVVGPGLKDKQQRTWIDVDLASLLNLAYAEGRKAERERCADIARQHFSCEGIAQDIEKQIMGGQDGE